jgi:hypothetical protein
MSNLQSTWLVPQTRLLSAKKVFAKAAIILATVATIAALLVCISMQGAPAIELNNLVAP